MQNTLDKPRLIGTTPSLFFPPAPAIFCEVVIEPQRLGDFAICWHWGIQDEVDHTFQRALRPWQERALLRLFYHERVALPGNCGLRDCQGIVLGGWMENLFVVIAFIGSGLSNG